MFWNKRYKEYPLIVRGNAAYGYQYILNIYSGEYRLPMLIDSGATLCQIGDTMLEGCQYYDTKQTECTTGLGGNVISKKILLEFNLEEDQSTDKYQFSVDTMVLKKEDNLYFNSGELCGILGANFLRTCDVDFRRGVIKVYNSIF